jgi:hypothetical protein
MYWDGELILPPIRMWQPSQPYRWCSFGYWYTWLGGWPRTEAEYISLSLTVDELFWLRMLLKELHIVLTCPPTIWCDNSGALALASNPVFHARTKHIEVDFHFIPEKVANRDIQLQYLPTFEQIADIFTKGHSTDRFCYLRDKLRVVPPLSLQGILRKSIRIMQRLQRIMQRRKIWITLKKKRKKSSVREVAVTPFVVFYRVTSSSCYLVSCFLYTLVTH